MPDEIIVTLEKIHMHLESLQKQFLDIAKERMGDSQNIVDVYLTRQLEDYNKYLFFIIQKLSKDIDNSQIYLSQLRTLIEILTDIVYILSLDTQEAAQVIYCEDLIVLQKTIPETFEENFMEYAKNQPNLYVNVNDFPQSYDLFSKTKLRKIQNKSNTKLLFPDTFEKKMDILTGFVLRNTITTRNVLPLNISGSFLHTWESFSYHVHGSHFFKDKFGKEQYWLAQKKSLQLCGICGDT